MSIYYHGTAVNKKDLWNSKLDNTIINFSTQRTLVLMHWITVRTWRETTGNSSSSFGNLVSWTAFSTRTHASYIHVNWWSTPLLWHSLSYISVTFPDTFKTSKLFLTKILTTLELCLSIYSKLSYLIIIISACNSHLPPKLRRSGYAWLWSRIREV